MTTPVQFQQLVAPVALFAQGRALDVALQRDLNLEFPPEGESFQRIREACHAGIAAGWMCGQGDAKRRFGRIFEAARRHMGSVWTWSISPTSSATIIAIPPAKST